MTVRVVSIPHVGDTLPNGAIVIALKQTAADVWVVLAINKPGTKHAEYVTWLLDTRTDAYWGRYFRDLDPAVADYNERT